MFMIYVNTKYILKDSYQQLRVLFHIYIPGAGNLKICKKFKPNKPYFRTELDMSNRAARWGEIPLKKGSFDLNF